jgi:predicted NACHT family NTPase
VQDIRSALYQDIQALHGKMQICGEDLCYTLSDLFVNIDFIEKVRGNRVAELAIVSTEFQRTSNNDRYKRISFSGSKHERTVLKILESDDNLTILGNPGSGKTTVLQWLATECNLGNIHSHRIPVLIKLRDFIDDARSVDYSLENFISQQLWERTTREAKLIFKHGKAIILLDGLDEVNGESRKESIDEIQKFSRTYPQVKIIITCRTEAMDIQFDKFDRLEIANFNEDQIKIFAKNWFKFIVGEGGKAKANEFLCNLFSEVNQPILDLASTPVLLSLACRVFNDNGKFYSNRAELYKQAIEILLEDRDRSQNITRDRTYLDLSLERKIELLTYLAVKKFKQEQYILFDREEIEAYISQFLGINNAKQAISVVRSIESQHGLLIRQSRSVWSFSHLTFQEYFVAKYFCDRQELSEVVNYISNGNWREIFLLIMENSPTYGVNLILAIQSYTHALIQHDRKLQDFLEWVNAKSCKVHSPYPQKEFAIRAFYFKMGIKSQLHFYTGCMFDFYFDTIGTSMSIDTFLFDRLILAFERIPRFIDEGFETEFHAEDGQKYINYELYRELASIDLSSRIHLESDPNLSPELIESLEALEELVPPFLEDREKYTQWWEDNHIDWANNLRDIIISHRNIGIEWEFSEEQNQLLVKYDYCTKLLFDCINANSHLDKLEIGNIITSTLFLPVEESEKRKLQN